MSKEWVTVKECMGLPGFPTTAPAVRQKLDDLSLSKSESKRKRSGGKAYEYHISILPKFAQSLFMNNCQEQKNDTQQQCVDELKSNTNSELHDVWSMIFKLLTTEQQKECIELFKNHGLSALLPAIVDPIAYSVILQQRTFANDDLPPVSHEAIHLAIMLNELPKEKIKEILQRYGVEERDQPVTHNSPHRHKRVS